ncbi:MAG: GTPase HflX [Peptococcaceae bacterium]|nr:GTPase HflX [Peptococcaceae bacterium]
MPQIFAEYKNDPIERALLMGVCTPSDMHFEESMQELRALTEACGVVFAGLITQNLDRVHPTHYVGTGKVQELALQMAADDANVLIANDELSPSQLRNLENALQCKIIDRTILILEIFAAQAQTKEAMLQVEIAHWQYMLPRLIGMRASLGRQVGGVGTKNKGVGETKLELDRRKIEKRIAQLNDDLEQLVRQRQNQRKRRHKQGLPVVSLVGYTNAGKSTLMNALINHTGDSGNNVGIVDATEDNTLDLATDILPNTALPYAHKQVLVKDQPFATLETAVRRISLAGNKVFLLTDTVGFIHKLPHHLIKAFRSTLEEIKESDLLVHVVDFSAPHYMHHISVTEQTLQKIGVDNIPIIYAYNKADLNLSQASDDDLSLPRVHNGIIYMSAKQEIGINELMALIEEQIFQDYLSCQMFVPYNRADIVNYLQENAHIVDTIYEETGTRLQLECSNRVLETLRGLGP